MGSAWNRVHPQILSLSREQKDTEQISGVLGQRSWKAKTCSCLVVGASQPRPGAVEGCVPEMESVCEFSIFLVTTFVVP